MAYCTVKEIAERCGVTPQGINKHLRSSGLRAKCKLKGNRLMIPETVQKLLETHFNGQFPYESETLSGNNGNPATKSETVSIPFEVYQDLRKQLEAKDEQIKVLNAALLNAQALQGAEQNQRIIAATTREKTRWQRLKSAWRG